MTDPAQTPSSNDVDLVLIHKMSDMLVSNVVASFFQSHGINVKVRESARWIEFLVPAADAERAKDVLSEWESFYENYKNMYPKAARKLSNQICENIWYIATPALILGITIGKSFWFPATLFFLGSGILLVCAPAYLFQRRLFNLGYEWPTVGDSNLLLWRCGRRAYNLPSASEVEMVPGFRRDADNLIRFVEDLNTYRREVRRKQGRLQP